MKKTEFLERAGVAHRALISALDGLTEEDAARVGLTAEWSVKDALAHVAAWETEGALVLEGLRQGAVEAPKLDKETIDRFNAAAVEERRGRTLAEVREEFDARHRRTGELLASMPDELDESSREYHLAEILAVRHYTHHAAQIEEWKKKIGEEKAVSD